MDRGNIDKDKFKHFILYEEHSLIEGGTLQLILDFCEWIKNNNFIKKHYGHNVFNIFIEEKKKTYSIIETKISEYNQLAKKILNYNYCYIPISLPKHLVGFFIYKLNQDNYDISIINTGSGCEYQKIFNKDIFGKKINFTNGIVIFKNINYNNLLDFIEYILFIQDEKNNIELNLERFNELLYTCISDKLLNFNEINFESDLSEKNILFELPTQIIGDCSFKSFIYSIILMDFYGIVSYNIPDYQQNTNTNNIPSYTKENILRSLKNYWNLYYEFFIKFTDEHIKLLNESNYDTFNKNYREFHIEEKDYDKIINFNLSSLYIIKEKNYNYNSIYKFYSKEDLKKFNDIDLKISQSIIDLSKKNLDDYKENLNKKIEDFYYWFEFPDIEYIKYDSYDDYDKKKDKNSYNLESLCKLIDDLHSLGKDLNIKYKNTQDVELNNKKNLNSIDDEILNKITLEIKKNLNKIIFIDELENFNNFINIYGIFKKLLVFLFEIRLIIISYDNFNLILNFFYNMLEKIKFSINKIIMKHDDNKIKINFTQSLNLVSELISSYILVRINDYKYELSNIHNLLFFPKFEKITEKNNNKDIIQKFISKKFFKKEIFNDDIDKYITWIQNYFQSDTIQFNLILFTKQNYSELDKFLLKNDENDDNIDFSNYIKIIEFIYKVRDDVIQNNEHINNWTFHFEKQLNNKKMFDKITEIDKNSIEKLINEKIDEYIYIFEDNIHKKYYETSKLIKKILFEYKEYVELKFIKYINKNNNDIIVILFFNYIGIKLDKFINIDEKKNKDNTFKIFYLRCLDFINPYESDYLEQSDIQEDKNDDYYYDYYGGSKLQNNNLKGGSNITCDYFKVSSSPIDIHYLVECVNNSIIPDILQNNYFLIKHNYYVKNINSKNIVYENNLSSYKLFNNYIKNNFEKNIYSYLTNIVDNIPFNVDCIGLIIITCQLFLFCHSLDIQIKNSFDLKNNICDYIKIYLSDVKDINSFTILLNCYISLLVGIDNDKLIYKDDIDIIKKMDQMKKNLIENILDILNKINNYKSYNSKTFDFDEKYLWYLVSVIDLFKIIKSIDKNYIKSNASDINKYENFKKIKLYLLLDKICVKPKIKSVNYDYYKIQEINDIELVIDKATNKLYNYISYYCYLLTNFFIWNKISKVYVFGKVNLNNDIFNYSILFNNIDNKYYKINEKNINLIIKNNIFYEKDLNDKLNEYVLKCSFILVKKDIIELINKYEILTFFLNKLNKFIKYEQIIFWKEQNDSTEQILIEIPEYKISFTFKPESNGILRFKNYDMKFNYDKKETLLFFNLVSNVPNFFLLKNSQDGEYYLLNISNIFYWDIIKIHYSGLFILFENDITLLNYICNLKNYWANHIVVKNIKNNLTFQKIFMKKYNNKNTEQNLKKNILSEIKVLYDKTIINLTNSNYMINIYKEYSINLNDLVNGYLNKINTFWKKFNLPFIFEIPEFYSWKKIFFDCLYLDKLNYYQKIIKKNKISNIVFNVDKFKHIKIKKDRENQKNDYGYYDTEQNQNNSKSNIKTPCEKSFDFNEPIENEYIQNIKKLYINNETPYNIELNFSEDSIKCFIETFFIEKKKIYINTITIINSYFEDIIQRFKISYDNIKKDIFGGGLPNIPDLYQYKSYQDHNNKNGIILIEYINKEESIIDKDENISNWDKLDFTIINKNPYDIKITSNTIKSLSNYDFILYINKIIILYNDKIVDLFYNSCEFRYICLLHLFKKIKNNQQLIDKKYLNINSTLSIIFYQFLMGGLIREEQINIISSILKDYGFYNTYLDIIINTYDINKKNIYKDFLKLKNEKSSLFLNNKILSSTETKRNIYNLIMGSGKTKFITPIICIFICELIKNFNLNNKMLLILPQKLVNQSKIFLSYMLEYFLNINVILIDKNNLNIINSSNSNGKILLCSDENLKYYFLGVDKKIENNFAYQVWNPKSNIVLIDEADIILDPMTSEMNYPIQESKKFLNKSIYLQIINIIFIMFSSETILDAKNILIEECKKLGYDLILYINFMDFIKLHSDSNNNIDKIFNLYIHENPNSKIQKLKNINYDTYCFYDYVYNIYLSIETVWNMVNRKDFGFALDNNELVTPFKYSETPMIGSEFNGIFINMMLTIKAYLYDKKINFYKLCKFMKFIITKIKNLNIKKYKSNEFYKFIVEKFKLYNLPNILFKFNIEFGNNDNIENLKIQIINLDFESSIDMLTYDKDIILMYCKYILYDNLYYYDKQLNISGIDITFSHLFNFISGFTGTPEDKFEYIDLNPLKILKKNPKSICLESDAIKINCSVLNYKFDLNNLNKFTENYDYKKFVLSNIINYTKYNVLIDVGSIFINSTFYELAELIFYYFSHIERFIFIDQNDEIFYIDKKNIISIIPWDYSIFDTDLVFFDNSHTTGIDFILPNKFIGLVTMRTNTRYRDFIQGLYRLRKINSTQKADIFILPNVFNNPIVTNQFTNLIIFKNKSEEFNKIDTYNTDDMVNMINTNLTIDNIIEILEINEKYYFIDQKYYFNIQKLRVIKTFYNLTNNVSAPNEIINTFNKVTTGFEDYINDKIIMEIKDIYNKFILKKKEFIEKYFSKNYKDLLNNICNIIEFYKKNYFNNNKQKNLSTQLQILTQEQIDIETSIQTQINKNYSNGYTTNDNKLIFDISKIDMYSDYINIYENSYVKKIYPNEKDKKTFYYNSFNFIYSYIINNNNYNEKKSSDTYILTLSNLLLLENKNPIIYNNKLYIFNNFLILFIKNNKNKNNLFKVGEFYEILNISNYYKKNNIQHIIFDIFGNIIFNLDMKPNEYELSLISNIKFYFACLSFKENKNYMIPNYKNIFNYIQIQKFICSSKIYFTSILDLFESINLPVNNSVFDLSKIYSSIILTIVLILLRDDPLLFSENIDVNKFIKNNFIHDKNKNLNSDLNNIIDGVRKLWTNNIFKMMENLYESDKEKYKLFDKNNFNVINYQNVVNIKVIFKCVRIILKKKKIWDIEENLNLQKSLNIFKIIIRLFVPIQNNIKISLFNDTKHDNLFRVFEKYSYFINLIQDDNDVNLINPNETIDNFFNFFYL